MATADGCPCNREHGPRGTSPHAPSATRTDLLLVTTHATCAAMSPQTLAGTSHASGTSCGHEDDGTPVMIEDKATSNLDPVIHCGWDVRWSVCTVALLKRTIAASTIGSTG